MSPADPKLEMLKALPLFAGLGGRDLERVAHLLDEVEVPAGRVLMRQGDHGDEMYIVVSGGFTIERDGHSIRECGPGMAFGEMALLAEGPRTATVIATEPSRLLVAGHREFHALMDVAPEISRHMLTSLARVFRDLDADGAH